MSLNHLLLAIAAFIILYLALILVLLGLGRGSDARSLARFIPDCVVLLRRLISDPTVPRSRKLVLLLLIAYLAFPLDLIPDFLPVIGQLDDVIVAALALRIALRSGGPDLLRRHWPGPEESLKAVLRVVYGAPKSGL